MINLQYSQAYENWAPVLGRVFLGALFLVAALYKIPGTESFLGEVAYAGGAGVPFASTAVMLAGLIEFVAGLALIIGWKTRAAAFLLAMLTIIFTVVFNLRFADPMQVTQFLMHLSLVGGLFYVSVYGAQYASASKDILPRSGSQM